MVILDYDKYYRSHPGDHLSPNFGNGYYNPYCGECQYWHRDDCLALDFLIWNTDLVGKHVVKRSQNAQKKYIVEFNHGTKLN